MTDPNVFLLCSDCFRDQGLQLNAVKIGVPGDSVCPNCGSRNGGKLDASLIGELATRFYVWGTLDRQDYGAAPVVRFNSVQPTDISPAPWSASDLKLLEKTLGVGFFRYAPPLWLVGQVEPLLALQNTSTRSSAIARILTDYPAAWLSENERIFRIRRGPERPEDPAEYDSPPTSKLGTGRFDTTLNPVMYASQDLPVCVHECRVTAEDDVYVATLVPTAKFKLLDLTAVLDEQSVSGFESLDLAVYMLFLAGEYSYEISRDIARAAESAGFDGVAFPSYFSFLRTGGMPFETSFGISNRSISGLRDRERSKIIPNLALFGRPIADGTLEVRCINRLILQWVEYGFHFGPVGYK